MPPIYSNQTAFTTGSEKLRLLVQKLILLVEVKTASTKLMMLRMLILLEVIENGATLPKTQVVKGVTIEMPITTIEEKAQRRLKSDQAEEGPNYALMDFSSSSSNSEGNPQVNLQDQGVIDSGWSRYITGNMSYLTDYEEIDGGYVAFGENPKGRKIIGKATKDETSGILKSFITRIENLVYDKVKVIRCDNGTKFKNREMNQFCEMKGILRQFSVARTPQQNGVTERRNKTLIKAARTMLAGSKLPTTFLAEVVNIACYVQNRVLVVKPHNKAPYELFQCRTPTLSFMRPFKYPVTILNTIDYLAKFDGKTDEGFFVVYSLNTKAFRVFNSITRIVKENLHIRFSESTPNVVSSGPDWLFDIDALKRTMNYEPIVAGTQFNGFADPKSSHDDGSKPSSDDGKKVDEDPRKENECNDQEKEDNVNNTNNVNTVSSTVDAAGTNKDNKLPFDPNMPALEDTVSTPIETQKPLLKDEDGEEVYVHMYRSMIGSLMYLTSLRPDIMFAVCDCARYQVSLKVSHLYAVKRILKYLKGHPKLGIWYPKDFPIDLVAYTDSDYAKASLDRKSTIGGCQFFRCRLISWQCKK
nr:putative ribonuclease H-like domain-containing protein [Tanacetum cinerariifolium]